MGLDYRHGTGHGVGSFLNVHEGPIGISSRSSALKVWPEREREREREKEREKEKERECVCC